jgi:MoaA/NifB/PqqE/SkfB family radical SAM enzyme
MIDALYRRVYESANYRLRWIGNGRLSSLCRPTSIIFLLTERCNARCLHCNIWQNRGQEDSPSFEQWKQVVTDLREWLGPVQVSFSGGEALLKPWAIDLVRHAAASGLFVEHLTHGYWLDQTKIEGLALANPSRITMSLDGIGATHDKVRGRDNFFARASVSIDTLNRVRAERGLRFTLRFKTVVMEHNINELADLAQFAADHGAEIFYQPIEQNYNTAPDPHWYESSANWPRDTAAAIAAVRGLIALKRGGLPIANSFDQLEAMTFYFGAPDPLRIAVQGHTAHEKRPVCSALTMLQFQANGDATVCTGLPSAGNITKTPVRQIWNERFALLSQGCCQTRLSS